MKIVVDNIEQFRNFFEVIYDSSSDLLEFQLFQDRMVCTVLDRTKTRFFHVVYDCTFFDLYDVDDVESVVVFVDDLYKLLKSCNKNDVLILEIDDPYLKTKVMSENGNSRLFEFVLPSDFIDSPTPPHIDLPANFDVDVGDLEQSVKDIELIGSDLFTFLVNGNELTIMTSPEVSTKYANVIDVDLDKKCEQVSSSFTVEFVKQMLKFKKIAKTVELKIGDSMPVFYTFKDDFRGVTINGMIAPRISEE